MYMSLHKPGPGGSSFLTTEEGRVGGRGKGSARIVPAESIGRMSKRIRTSRRTSAHRRDNVVWNLGVDWAATDRTGLGTSLRRRLSCRYYNTAPGWWRCTRGIRNVRKGRSTCRKLHIVKGFGSERLHTLVHANWTLG